MAEMVKRRTVWVPTIDHNRYYVDAKDEYGFKPEAIAMMNEMMRETLTIGTARKATLPGWPSCRMRRSSIRVTFRARSAGRT